MIFNLGNQLYVITTFMDTGSFIAYSLIDEEDVKPLEIGSWNEPCLHLNYANEMPIIFISTSGTVVLWE